MNPNTDIQINNQITQLSKQWQVNFGNRIWVDTTIYTAAYQNKLYVIKWFYNKFIEINLGSTEIRFYMAKAFEGALRHGQHNDDYSLAAYIFNNQYPEITVTELIVKTNTDELIQLTFAGGYRSETLQDAIDSIMGDKDDTDEDQKLDVLKFLAGYDIYPSDCVIDDAIEFHLVDCLDWLLQNGYTLTENQRKFIIDDGDQQMIKMINKH